MAEEIESPGSSAPPGGQGGDPAAMDLALSGASREKADAFLEKQGRLSDEQIKVASAHAQFLRIQSEDLRREDKLRHWSLRVHHISDVMKLTFQFAGALVVLAVVVFIGGALWNAVHDNGLVIEAFSVPPDMAARGVTGQVVASQLLDKLAAMQDATNSTRPAESYANDWGNDIKVEIPDTGVSIGEFYRYLASWLGHETHVTGEVYRSAGGIAVTARAGTDGSATVSGAESDIDKLLQQAAEKIYERTQPYRYSAYIQTGDHPQFVRARVILQGLAVEGSLRERAWAYNGLGVLDNVAGDSRRSLSDYRRAIALDPDLDVAYSNIATVNTTMGHDEAALAAVRTDIGVLQQKRSIDISDRARIIMLANDQSNLAFALDDFGASLRYSEEAAQDPDFNHLVERSRDTIIIDLAELHENTAAHQSWRDLPAPGSAAARSIRAAREVVAPYWMEEWSFLLARWTDIEKEFETSYISSGFPKIFVNKLSKRRILPYVATAMAMSGDFRGAHALIDRTPADCDVCLRNRADIDEAEKNWGGAAYWYARAVAQTPSIPLGYWEWGRMLMGKGDLDGAIAKFQQANEKGPHFADPLEMWGEALMLKNHSDLALAKFEEANNYAPNWGRLHLKWGEALLYAGDKAGAAKQFAIARGFDLTASERSELARMRGAHG